MATARTKAAVARPTPLARPPVAKPCAGASRAVSAAALGIDSAKLTVARGAEAKRRARAAHAEGFALLAAGKHAAAVARLRAALAGWPHPYVAVDLAAALRGAKRERDARCVEARALALAESIAKRPGGARVAPRQPPSYSVEDVALDPSGELVAGMDGTNVYVWLRRSGELRRTLVGAHAEAAAVKRIDMTSGGRLVSTDDRGIVVLWDVHRGDVLEKISLGEPVLQLAFSPDGKRIAMTLGSGALAVYDATTLKQRWKRDGAGHAALAWRADGKQIATAGEVDVNAKQLPLDRDADADDHAGDGQQEPSNAARAARERKLAKAAKLVRLWRARDGRPQGQLRRAKTVEAGGLAYSPSGRLLALTDRKVEIYQLARKRRRPRLFEASDTGKPVAFVDEARLMVGAKLYSLKTGKSAGFELPVTHAKGLAISRDRRVVACGNFGYVGAEANRAVVVGTVGAPKSVRTIGVLAGIDGASRLSFDRGRRLLLTRGKRLFVFDPRTRRMVDSVDTGTQIEALALTGDGSVLVAGGRQLSVWSKTLARKLVLPLPAWSSTVAYSPRGKLIALGVGRKVELRRLPGGALVRRLPEHNLQVIRLMFSRDGRTLVSKDWRRRAYVWDVATGKRRAQIYGERWAVAVHPRRDLLVAPSLNSLTLWWLDGKKAGEDYPGVKRNVSALAFSATGDKLAVARANGSVRLFAVSTAPAKPAAARKDGKLAPRGFALRELPRLGKHVDIGHSLAFQAGGTLLAVDVPPRTTALWRVDTKKRAGSLIAAPSGTWVHAARRSVVGTRRATELIVWRVGRFTLPGRVGWARIGIVAEPATRR